MEKSFYKYGYFGCLGVLSLSTFILVIILTVHMDNIIKDISKTITSITTLPTTLKPAFEWKQIAITEVSCSSKSIWNKIDLNSDECKKLADQDKEIKFVFAYSNAGLLGCRAFKTCEDNSQLIPPLYPGKTYRKDGNDSLTRVVNMMMKMKSKPYLIYHSNSVRKRACNMMKRCTYPFPHLLNFLMEKASVLYSRHAIYIQSGCQKYLDQRTRKRKLTMMSNDII